MWQVTFFANSGPAYVIFIPLPSVQLVNCRYLFLSRYFVYLFRNKYTLNLTPFRTRFCVISDRNNQLSRNNSSERADVCGVRGCINCDNEEDDQNDDDQCDETDQLCSCGRCRRACICLRTPHTRHGCSSTYSRSCSRHTLTSQQKQFSTRLQHTDRVRTIQLDMPSLEVVPTIIIFFLNFQFRFAFQLIVPLSLIITCMDRR